MEINQKQDPARVGDIISVDPGYGTPLVGIVFSITPMYEGTEEAYDSLNIACPNGLTYTRSSKQKITVLERANYTYAPRGHFRIGDLATMPDGTRVILLSGGVTPGGKCSVCLPGWSSTTWVNEQDLTLVHAANHPVPPPIPQLETPADEEDRSALDAEIVADCARLTAAQVTVAQVARPVDMSRAELDREIDTFCATNGALDEEPF